MSDANFSLPITVLLQSSITHQPPLQNINNRGFKFPLVNSVNLLLISGRSGRCHLTGYLPDRVW